MVVIGAFLISRGISQVGVCAGVGCSAPRTVISRGGPSVSLFLQNCRRPFFFSPLIEGVYDGSVAFCVFMDPIKSHPGPPRLMTVVHLKIRQIQLFWKQTKLL